MTPRFSKVLILGAAISMSPACERDPCADRFGSRSDCGPISVPCDDAQACVEPATTEWNACEAACDDPDPCTAELCLVECLDVFLAAEAQCYADHSCGQSDSVSEDWDCKLPAIDDARDCLAMCSDETAAQVCADAVDEELTACNSPFV